MEDLWFEHPVPWTIDSKTFMIVSDPGCHHIWCTILVIYCYLVTHLPKSLTNPEAWNWKFKRRIWTAGYLCQGQSIKWMTAIKRLRTRHNWQRQSPNICFMLSMPLLIPWKNTWKMFNSPVFFPRVISLWWTVSYQSYGTRCPYSQKPNRNWPQLQNTIRCTGLSSRARSLQGSDL